MFVLVLVLLLVLVVRAFPPGAFLTAATVENPPVPALNYTWTSGQSGTKTIVVTNNNDATMTLTLGAWTGTRVTWITASPATITAHGTLNLQASITALEQNHSATATVNWSVTNGASGNITATATKETGS